MHLRVDVLSYGLWPVAPLSLGAYTLATALGGAPFSLLFTLQTTSNVFLLLVIALALECGAIGYYFFRIVTPSNSEEVAKHKSWTFRSTKQC